MTLLANSTFYQWFPLNICGWCWGSSLLRTPCPSNFGTYICSTCQDHALSRSVVIFWDYSLRTSLGTFSILLATTRSQLVHTRPYLIIQRSYLIIPRLYLETMRSEKKPGQVVVGTCQDLPWTVKQRMLHIFSQQIPRGLNLSPKSIERSIHSPLSYSVQTTQGTVISVSYLFEILVPIHKTGWT